MNRLEQKILRFISRECLISPGDSLLAALSGGPDSVFALRFLVKHTRRLNISVSAFHLNHSLRGRDSDADEAFCKKMCADLSVPLYSFKSDIKEIARIRKCSVEEAARYERYRIIDLLADEHKFSRIVTAHNSNDNAETILLNLFTGCGLHGISGIPVIRGKIIRPLLSVSKEEILEYLKENGIAFRVDKSNLSNDYRRNYLRNKIIPLLKKEFNPKLEDALFRSGRIFSQSRNVIEGITDKFIKKGVKYSHGKAFIEIGVIERSGELFGEILRNVLHRHFGREVTFEDFNSVKELASRQAGRKINLSSNLTALRERDGIGILASNREEEVYIELKAGECVSIAGKLIGISETKPSAGASKNMEKSEIIEADNIDDIFILRKWKSGDKFIPLGMRGFKKISDFLTDKKTASSEKKEQLVLLNRNNIVWVCGLRIDDRYKIKDNSKRVLHLWVKKQ